MLLKPPSCVGCPMYGDGRGFVIDCVVPGAVVQIVGQNPGEDEERRGVPFVGKTGQLMRSKLWPLAGLTEDTVSLHNIIKCRLIVRGRRVNTLPSGKALAAVVAHCTQAHLRLDPNLLTIAQGAVAWEHLAPGRGSISEWRGFLG